MDSMHHKPISAMGPMAKVMVGVAAAGLLVALCGQARADQHLLVNGSFENGMELVDTPYKGCRQAGPTWQRTARQAAFLNRA